MLEQLVPKRPLARRARAPQRPSGVRVRHDDAPEPLTPETCDERRVLVGKA